MKIAVKELRVSAVANDALAVARLLVEPQGHAVEAVSSQWRVCISFAVSGRRICALRICRLENGQS